MSLTHACAEGRHGGEGCDGVAHTGLHCLMPGVPDDCCTPCTCSCHKTVAGMFRQVDIKRHYWEPVRAYLGDAGYDLRSPVDTILNPGMTATVALNVAVDFPPGWFGLVAERSSQGSNGVHAVGGVIDEGYTGEIRVNLVNTRREAVIVHQGDKVGQLVLVPRFIDPRDADLPTRGGNGFGSSGR